MTRRAVRDQVFKLLFRVEFHDLEEMENQTQLFFEDEAEEKQTSKEVCFYELKADI